MTTVEATKDHPDHYMFKPFKATYGRLSLGEFPVVDLPKPEGLSGCAEFLAGTLTATHSHRSQVVTCYLSSGGAIDWDFSVLTVGQSATEYWNQEADKLKAAGVDRIEIEFRLRRAEVFEWI